MMFKKRIEELELVNAKFLQQIENVVDQSTISGMGEKINVSAQNIIQDLTMEKPNRTSPQVSHSKSTRPTSNIKKQEETFEVSINNQDLRSQIKGIKDKLKGQQDIANLDNDAVFWKNNYEVKNQQFIELKQQFQQFNEFIRGQGDETDPQKNYLICTL